MGLLIDSSTRSVAHALYVLNALICLPFETSSPMGAGNKSNVFVDKVMVSLLTGSQSSSLPVLLLSLCV